MQTSVYVREQATSGTGKAYYKYRRIKEGQGRRTGGYTAPFYIRVTHNGVWFSALTLVIAKYPADCRSRKSRCQTCGSLADSTRFAPLDFADARA
jgi:hypothetical protein